MSTQRRKTDWFMHAKWGVFFHFLAPNTLNSLPLEKSVETWNEMVDAFDVEALAKELHEVGARYCIFTIGQNTGHYCSPNKAYDKVVRYPFSKCSRRDLIADLADALAVYDIRLITYFPNNAPVQDPAAVAMLEDALGERRVAFQNRWQDVIGEWSLRWGKKVSGWWIDGSYFNDIMYELEEEPNWSTFAGAMRAGNSESILAFNPGVSYPPYTVSAEEDYTAGEVNEPQEVDSPGRWDKHAQFHYLSYLGQYWGAGSVRFNASQIIEFTRSITDHGGVVTWDVPHDMKGHMNKEAFTVFKALGQEIDKMRNNPLQPPTCRLKPSVKFTKVPVMDESGQGDGLVELTVKNRWDKEVSDAITVTVDPSDFAAIDGTDVYPFQLKSKEEQSIVFKVTQKKSAEEVTKPMIRLQRKGDQRIFCYPFPVRKRIQMPLLSDNISMEAMRDAMADIEAATIIARGRALGNMRMAISGNNLALYVEVLDAQKVCTEIVWDGSCIELFGVAETKDKINQLFLQPGSQGEKAKVLIMPGDVKIAKGKFSYVPFEAARYETEDTVTGYNGWALISIPAWLRTTAVLSGFYMNISLTAGEKNGAFIRATLFGSGQPANITDGYARVEI